MPGANRSVVQECGEGRRVAEGVWPTCHATLDPGAVGLRCAAHSESSLAEIKATLLQSVDQPASLRGKVRTNGRLNIARALQILARTDLPPVVIHTGPKVLTDADLDALRLTVTFNKRKNPASVEEVFSVTNSIQGNTPGSFAWAEDGRPLTFTVNRRWPVRTRGFVTIKGQAKDSTRLRLPISGREPGRTLVPGSWRTTPGLGQIPTATQGTARLDAPDPPQPVRLPSRCFSSRIDLAAIRRLLGAMKHEGRANSALDGKANDGDKQAVTSHSSAALGVVRDMPFH